MEWVTPGLPRMTTFMLCDIPVLYSEKKMIFQLEYFDVGTPLSNKYYLGCPSGEMYGLNHVQERVKPEVIMQIRPETEVPGLYLTGECI